MRRRRLLTGLAAGCGSLISGCADGVSFSSEGSANGTSRTTVAPTVAKTPAKSQFAADLCPEFDTPTICYHTASESAPALLVPSRTTVSLAGATIGFTLHNQSDVELSFHPYEWKLWQHTDEWIRGPDPTNRLDRGSMILSPNGTYSWQVAVGPMSITAQPPPITVNDLDLTRGLYAFGIEATGETRWTYVSLFEVVE